VHAANTRTTNDLRSPRTHEEGSIVSNTTQTSTTGPTSTVSGRVRRTLAGADNGRPGRDGGAAGHPLTDLGMAPAPDPTARPPARVISNAVSAQPLRACDPWGRSELVWAWGQFLDHELDLVPDGGEVRLIPIPDDDPQIEFRGTSMMFRRSLRDADGRLVNRHSSYVDASNVYGVDDARLDVLRGDGGRMATIPSGPDGEEMLPKHPGGDEIENADQHAADRSRFFLAGDVRANEHGVLTSLHTVFVREHNHWVERYRAADPTLGPDELFERARAMVAAEMQAITYQEFIPALLGPDALPPYIGYDETVDPAISNVFASAIYRLGHSMVNDDVVVSASDHRIPLADVFFNPEFVDRLGVDPFLRHLPYREIRPIDTSVVPGLRNHLFTRGSSPAGLLDLVSLNIERGRDHGLPTYNDCRRRLGLAPIARCSDLRADDRVVAALERVYPDVDQLDLWVAALAEQPSRDDRRLGDVMHGFLVDQFRRCRDGDWFWYQRDGVLTDWERFEIEHTTLATVLGRNTGACFAGDVFHVPT
jgi:peroxidase